MARNALPPPKVVSREERIATHKASSGSELDE
jgi:hypothetical protein